MNIIYIVVVLVLVIVLVAYFIKGAGGTSRTEQKRFGALYQNLLRKCFNDKEQVARLIELERERSPNASQLELMQHAIARWERHNN